MKFGQWKEKLMIKPNRGQVWLANLEPTIKNKTSQTTPVLIISDDALNHGTSKLLMVLPLISTKKTIASQIAISFPAVDLKTTFAIRCETILSISHKRLVSHFADVSPHTMSTVDQALRFLLAL
jgi:mRNA interferase MazF